MYSCFNPWTWSQTRRFTGCLLQFIYIWRCVDINHSSDSVYHLMIDRMPFIGEYSINISGYTLAYCAEAAQILAEMELHLSQQQGKGDKKDTSV